MEEKVKDAYNNLKDRFSNPFIFSFIFSWLIYNWKIPVALIRYDKSQFTGCGCQTIFDFISYQYYATEGSVRYPIMFAILYSAFNPVVKNLVRAYNTWSSKWGGNWNLEISKDANVSYEKYIKLRKKYSDKLLELVEIEKEEKKYLEENKELLNQINEKNNNLNVALSERNDLEISIYNMTKSDFLNGYWKYTHEQNDSYSEFFGNKTVLVDDIFIKDNDFYIIENGKRNREFYITEFIYNKRKNSILFIKAKLDNEIDDDYHYSKTNFVNILSLKNNDENLLEGTENGRPVKYQRIDSK